MLFSWSNDQPLYPNLLFKQGALESDLTCELATHEMPGLSLGVRVTQAGGRSCADRSPMHTASNGRHYIRCLASAGSIGKGCEAKQSEPEVRTTGGVAKKVAGAG